MWARFMRLIRSFMGLFFRSMENPELMLKQAMDDLRAEIPKMNENAAKVITQQKLLEQQAATTTHNVADLEKKVEMAVKGGDATKDAALRLISALQTERDKLARIQEGLQLANENSKKILEMRAAFEQRIQKQIEECRAKLSDAQMANAEEQMANIMGTFTVADLSGTIEDASRGIDERLAHARAKMQVAGESTDAQMAKVDLMAENATAEDEYSKLQAQYGLAPAVDSPKTMTAVVSGSIPIENASAYEPLKTAQPVNVTIKTQ